MTSTMERKWQMTRLWPGQYLLPSNDRQTLWKITRYEERDGTLTRGDGSVVNDDFWRLERCTYQLDTFRPEHYDLQDAWREVACMLPTRQAAINEAMSYEDDD